jgi:hypothetical protein
VSKYRVEFKSSQLLLVLQLLSYVVLVLSVLYWQSEIVQYEFIFQIIVLSIVTILMFKSILHSKRKKRLPTIFSVEGEWIESNIYSQVSWKITDKSRVSQLILFINLISPLNTHKSKWYLLFKDQINECDFRRISRAIVYQQQKSKDY